MSTTGNYDKLTEYFADLKLIVEEAEKSISEHPESREAFLPEYIKKQQVTINKIVYISDKLGFNVNP
jgi:hypothetical protein